MECDIGQGGRSWRTAVLVYIKLKGTAQCSCIRHAVAGVEVVLQVEGQGGGMIHCDSLVALRHSAVRALLTSTKFAATMQPQIAAIHASYVGWRSWTGLTINRERNCLNYKSYV